MRGQPVLARRDRTLSVARAAHLVSGKGDGFVCERRCRERFDLATRKLCATGTTDIGLSHRRLDCHASALNANTVQTLNQA
jgi:hypothetical protein